MSLTAGTLLADAEALAYPYISERATATGALLRTLSTLDSEVTGMIASIAPHILTEDATPVTIVFATNPAGYTLDAARAYVDFKYEDAEGIFYPVRVVPMKQLDQAQQHPAIVLEGQTALPVDTAGKRFADTSDYRKFWVGNGDKLHYRKITNNTTLTALANTLKSPDYAHQYLVWSLAYAILLAFNGVDGIVPPEKLSAVGQAIGASKRTLWQSIADAASVEASIHTPMASTYYTYYSYR